MRVQFKWNGAECYEVEVEAVKYAEGSKVILWVDNEAAMTPLSVSMRPDEADALAAALTATAAEVRRMRGER